MARDMTPEEYRAFMLDGTRTGKLATVRQDGRPHVAPIWFTMDGDDLLFTTHEKSVKGQNIQRDGRVALTVDDPNPPYSFIIVEGEIEIMNVSPDELVHWATVIGGRYMGADRAVEFGKRNGVPGELLIRLHPTKIIAKLDVSGY